MSMWWLTCLNFRFSLSRVKREKKYVCTSFYVWPFEIQIKSMMNCVRFILYSKRRFPLLFPIHIHITRTHIHSCIWAAGNENQAVAKIDMQMWFAQKKVESHISYTEWMNGWQPHSTIHCKVLQNHHLSFFDSYLHVNLLQLLFSYLAAHMFFLMMIWQCGTYISYFESKFPTIAIKIHITRDWNRKTEK